VGGPVRIGILTVSDRASAGVYEDRGGPAVREALAAGLAPGWEAMARIVSDDPDEIRMTLVAMADECAMVVTTGGTGPAPRDVTPDVTRSVCDRELPGFGEAMRAASRARVPTAILSRQTAGLRGPVLIVNLPGSPRGAAECLAVVLPAAVHCIELAGGPAIRLTGDTVRPHP
jgi:molybdopterin adenylyltransferase